MLGKRFTNFKKQTKNMLQYNIDNLFILRNIKDKSRFLTKHGISTNLAHRISTGQYDKISLKIMEKLCRAFNCTPNDIYTFTPDNEIDKSELNALNKIAHTPTTYSDTNALYNLPLDKLSELAALINSKK